ncbi:HSPB1-associated protein 1 homolog isoform X2 [Amia ocellicauda]
MAPKPYTPGEARGIMEALKQPAVFCNMVSDWPGLQWSVEYLSHILDDKPIKFRIGRRQEDKAPLFETQCSYVEAKLTEFVSWTTGQTASPPTPFSDYPFSEYWAYADYKYIAVLLEDKSSMFEDIRWQDFGFPGRDGRESTLWIGTGGANTPCHLDSYGCNLVLQVQGRKRWYLFPPEDTHSLYPTRIPYEESSVFSKVNVVNPDFTQFPAFASTRMHMVTLLPGQVLFVPRHWWHYVESVDPITVSINSWMELDVDDEVRVSEALTRTIVCALKSAPGPDNTDLWLNPTEAEITSHEENLRYLNLAMQSCLRRPRRPCHEPTATRMGSTVARLGKRDCRGHPPEAQPADRDGDADCPSSLPFGPDLLAVPQIPSGQLPQSESGKAKTSSCEHSPPSKLRHELNRVCCGETCCQSTPERQESTTLNNGKHVGSCAGCPTISTNDLLDCLVHPDVIALATKILMEKQSAQ